jgi:molybdenum cofactor cytidylyltransferase
MRRGIVVLAAGLSRRMGGPSKLLARYRGQALAHWALTCAGAAPADRHVAVLGRDRAEVAALAPAGFVLVDNPNPDDGLASSLSIGLAALGEVDAAAVLLADMPDISPALVEALFARLGDGYACVPRCKNDWGNPVVLGAAAIADAQTLRGDRGARALLSANAHALRFLDWPDRTIFRDLDTPDDFMA